MVYTVPSPILFKTHHCTHNFSCLKSGKGNGPDGCEIDRVNGEPLVFLKSAEPFPSCPYRSAFGFGQICMCPTYFHLYKLINNIKDPFSR